ncbi:MAG: trypsin-like peptidase domain-containing protein [Bryobacteraceae bacterium]|nr:trypsin-like peptidase domain-containing protein [Bryobacteraceae bacterium]
MSACFRSLSFLLIALSIGAAQPPAAVEGRLYTPPAKAVRKTAVAELPGAQAGREARRLVLPRLPAEPLVRTARGQTPVGTARELASVEGRWDALPDGRRIWRIAIESPAAIETRVHFAEFSVGAGRVWVYGAGAGAASEPYSGQGPFGDGDFWSAAVEGDAIAIEYEPEQAGPAEEAPPFRISELAHVWTPSAPAPADPGAEAGEQAASLTSGAPQVATCHLDFKCYSQWQQTGSGVAHMRFVSDEDRKIYVCSGALLNTRASSLVPYFLTANHCISTDSEARSLETYWLYETAQCNGPSVTRAVGTRIDGARLMVTGAMSDGDFSLVRLTSLPSTPVWLAGWNPDVTAMGASLTGIHHPDGSYKRISFGIRAADRTANVGGTQAPAAMYYQSQMSSGRIEGGSSGSPLYNAGGQVVGVLSYGPVAGPGQTVCDIEPYAAGYGRFPVIYPSLRPFLEDQAASVAVTPTSLSFRVVNSVVQAPAEQTVRIETTSAAAVAFTLVNNATWLRLSRNSGSVSAAAPVSVTVSVDPAALRTPGTFTGAITLNAGASSQTVQARVEVAVTRSNVTASLDPDPVYEEAPDSDGYAWFYEVRVRETAGVETRLTQFRIDGTDYSGNITAWFGTDRIPAYGTISAGLRTRGLTPPANRAFDFAGVDPGTGVGWNRQITGRFLGRRNQATLKLTISPDPVSQNPASEECAWRHDVIVTEESGIGVNLNRWVAGGHDLSANIASWFDSARLDASGTRRATLCWKGVRVPATIEFEMAGRDDLGNDVRTTAEARFEGAPTQAEELHVMPESLAFSAVTGRAELLSTLAAVDASDRPWTARLTYGGAERNWLTAFPLSGLGAGTITVTASTTGLPAGRHTATLTVEVAGSNPATIPVAIVVGAQASATPSLTAAGVVNAASYQPALAPGMLFTIAGQNLAVRQDVATRVPLPYTMGNATVRVNNVLCPLLFVSSQQINAQLPYEIAPGRATVTVNVEGREATAVVNIAAVAPGVFTIDGRRPTPHFAGRRGDVVLAYVTGVGAVRPPVMTGAAPGAETSLADLPQPAAAVEVTVGGVRADLFFAGIPYGIVGAIQVNYRIPAGAPTGNQPVVFTVGGVRANTVTLDVQP